MENVFVITSIQQKYKYLLGPSLVAAEIFKEIKQRGYTCVLYDTYRPTKYRSVLAYFRIFITILFSKKSIIFIHSQGYITSLIFCLTQLIRPSHQVIYTLHGLPLQESIYRNNGKKTPRAVSIQDGALKAILFFAKKIVCVSNIQAQHIKKNYKIKANISVIHNGVHPQKGSLDYESNYCTTEKRAIMAGGIAHIKSTIETIKAFLAYNSTSNNKWKLDIYGNISDSYQVPLVTELCAQSKGLITFHGMLDQDSLHREMSKSDLYVAMSKWDTFNLAALQAMSLGVPCICSKQSGISELISDNMNGFLVNAESAELIEDCAGILHKIELLGETYTELRKAALKTATTHDWTYVTNNYLALAAKN